MATIAEILRDPKKSQDEKNEAIAQLAEDYENAPVDTDFEEREHWSVGVSIAEGDDVEGKLDTAFKSVKDSYAESQFADAKKALFKELKALGAGSYSLSITGVVPSEADEGEPWSYSISTQVGN